MKRWTGGAVLALLAVGCATPPPPPTATTTAVPIDRRIEAITADARRSEHEPDPKTRAELAEHASGEAQACLALAPQAAACLYGHALALGLEARAHPAHAGESLRKMLTELAAAESAEAAYDEAGPARVQALVLTRAPGWPLGPGDPATGVVAARRAAELRPHYPPNQLALAEALAKSGDAQGARDAYRRAREEALPLPASSDRDEWLQEAERALQH